MVYAVSAIDNIIALLRWRNDCTSQVIFNDKYPSIYTAESPFCLYEPMIC